jgi:transketolase
MVGVAAGLAKGGLRPVVYGLAAFVPMRVLEQIKLDVCYERLPVVFVGDGAGLVYANLGPSHQCCEDVAVLRSIPNLQILSPADAPEMAACMKLALNSTSPTYVRMGKADLGDVHERPPNIDWGRLCRVRNGRGRIAWIASGSMACTALTVAERWFDSPVWTAPSLKPLDAEPIVSICSRHEVVVVLEEHSIYGGLGAAIAEIAASYSPVWVCRIGINDTFSQRCGSYAYVLREHGLDVDSVEGKVQDFLARVDSHTHAIACSR